MADGSGKFWGGLLLGSAIGAVAGLLLAPRSGKDTRKLLQRTAQDFPELADGLGSRVDQLTESAQRSLEDAIERLQEAIAIGQEASRQVQQELTVSGEPKEAIARENRREDT